MGHSKDFVMSHCLLTEYYSSLTAVNASWSCDLFSFTQGGSGAESSRGVGFSPPVCLMGRSRSAAGEFK